MALPDLPQIKILYVLSSLNLSSGVSTFVMNYFRKFNHSRVIADFATYRESNSPYLEEIAGYGGKVWKLPPVWKIGRHYASCQKILRDGKYHIVHDNMVTKSLPLMVCAKREGVPVRILHSHNSQLGDRAYKDRLNRLSLRFLKSQCNSFFACSQKAGECYFSKERYTLIPNFITSSQFRYRPEIRAIVRERFQLREDALIIGTVARLAPQKNLYFALDVIKALIVAGTPVEYWLIGGGPLLESLKHYAEALQIQENVRFLGERDDVNALYHAMDSFLLPSFFEGMPITVVEAQAMGLPCVISDSITTEVAYTNLIRFVPLASGVDAWVEALSQCARRGDSRRSYAAELSASPFSEQAGQALYETYLRLLEGKC